MIVMKLKTKFIISPPFGNYVGHENATRVVGSFTLHPRPDLVKQTLKTLRPIKNGWVNKIGLRNKGIENVKWREDRIHSLAPIKEGDWEIFQNIIPNDYAIEINLGCPNVNHNGMISNNALLGFIKKCSFVSMKLPPTSLAHYHIEEGLHAGIRYFHMCNTIPVEAGGESGQRLKKRSLELIRGVRKEFGNGFNIIGGGGIYSIDDVIEYEKAGANHFSLATIWFKPLRALKILKN